MDSFVAQVVRLLVLTGAVLLVWAGGRHLLQWRRNGAPVEDVSWVRVPSVSLVLALIELSVGVLALTGSLMGGHDLFLVATFSVGAVLYFGFSLVQLLSRRSSVCDCLMRDERVSIGSGVRNMLIALAFLLAINTPEILTPPVSQRWLWLAVACGVASVIVATAPVQRSTSGPVSV